MVCTLEVSANIQVDVDENFYKGFVDFKRYLHGSGVNVQGRRALPTAIYHVLEKDRIDIFKSIIEKISNVNRIMSPDFYYKNRHLRTGSALHMAVALLNFEAVKLLVEKGADVNLYATECDGELANNETPLHIIAQVKVNTLNSREQIIYQNILKYLIVNGGDPYLRNGIMNSPLQMFADFGHFLALEECIRQGINVNRKCIQQNDNNYSLFQWLVLQNYHDKGNESSFRRAWFRNLGFTNEFRKEKIKHLIPLCLDFGAQCLNLLSKRSALDFAVDNRDPILAKLFLKHTPDLKKKNKQLPTISLLGYFSRKEEKPFHKQWPDLYPSKKGYHVEYSSCSDKIKTIFENELLLMKSIGKNDLDGASRALMNGAIPTGSIAGTRYPLHFASALGHSQIVDRLLSHNSPPNTLDSRKLTPLHHAASEGSQKVCKSLLRHGAAFNYPDPEGLSALKIAENSLAKGRNYNDVVELLKNVKILFKRMKSARSRTVLRELEKCLGSDDFWCFVNCINYKGYNLIGEALRLGRMEIALRIMELKGRASPIQ